MTRKLFGAALAVALAGGVYLSAAAPAQASNMGFKLEREFAPVNGFANLFYVSFPLFNGLGDVADTSHPTGSKCVGDTGGPAAGDTVINADDAICDLWTDRQGQLTFARYDIATCSFLTRSAIFNPAFGVTFTGTWTDPIPRDEAFQVQQTFPGSGVQNAAVIVGSHDPSYTGRLLAPNAACRADLQLALINLPYHTMYQNAIEVLCGLKGVDWLDADGDGVPEWIDIDGDTTPDPCPNGIYDQGHPIAVQWFDNVDDNSGPGGGDTDNQTIVCSIRPSAFPGQPPIFPDGTGCYDLIPGEGYIVQMNQAHAGTTFLSPHF
jgi:hypothetical protein